MATNLRIDFNIAGYFDGPVSQRLLDEGRNPDDIAQQVVQELKSVVLDALGDGPAFTHRVNVHATAKLHESGDNVGEASTE